MAIMRRIGKIVLVILLSLVFFLLLLFKSDIPQEELLAKYSYPESHFIEIDGVTLHVRLVGSGEPVILLHGSFSSLHTWDEWQREMSSYFLTISVDLPGHGLTGPDPLQRYTIGDYSQFVLRLSEKLNINKFHLAGNSMGGAVALKIADTRPDKVLSLNLIDAAGAPQIQPRQLDSDSASAKSSPMIFDLIKNPIFSKVLLKCTPKFLFTKNIQEVYGNPEKVHETTVDRYYDLMLREGNRQATLERFALPRDYVKEFSRITMPVLIQWGDRDRWIPISNALEFKKVMPEAHLVVFEGAGHVPMEEIPTESVAEYLSFLGVEIRKDYLQQPKFVTYAD